MIHLKTLIMDMLQENKLMKIIKIQIIVFFVFSIFAIIFYQYKPAHNYYHQEIFFSDFNGLIALVGFILKIIFFWIIILFPLLWITQLIILIKKKLIKKHYKQILVLTIVYFISVIALFSLQSINNKHSFKQKKIAKFSYTNRSKPLTHRKQHKKN